MVAQSAAFKKAADDSKNLQAKPTDEELLQLYALYKIGTGENFSAATQPGTFDFKAKYKYRAWEDEVKKGTTAEDAQSRYVELIQKLKGQYGFKE